MLKLTLSQIRKGKAVTSSFKPVHAVIPKSNNIENLPVPHQKRHVVRGASSYGTTSDSEHIGGFGGTSDSRAGGLAPDMLEPPRAVWENFALHFSDSGKIEITDTLREIWKFDNVGGPAVDVSVELAMGGGYDLTGIKDPAIKRLYEEQDSNVSVTDVGRPSNVDYLVDGNAVGFGVWDNKLGRYDGYLQLRKQDIEIVSHEFIGAMIKPVIKIKKTALTDLFSSGDDDLIKLRNKLPRTLRSVFTNATEDVILNDNNVLFHPREPSAGAHLGISWYSRLIVLYILEQFLIKGTVTSAVRRQRATLAMKVGSETFSPTKAHLDFLVSEFLKTEQDPSGSIFAFPEHYGVTFEEVWQAKDFWSWVDDAPSLYEAKAQALGIMASALTSESNFSNAEAGINMLMRRSNNIRQRFVSKYKQIFFINTARANMFVKRTEAELSHRIRKSVKDLPEPDLIYPTIHWRVPLENYGIEGLLDAFSTITEATGIPATVEDVFKAVGLEMPKTEEEWNEKIERDTKLKIFIRDAYKKAGLTKEEEF